MDDPDYSEFSAAELVQLLKARDLEIKGLRRKTQSAEAANEQEDTTQAAEAQISKESCAKTIMC
jgi:hypothetical protein